MHPIKSLNRSILARTKELGVFLRALLLNPRSIGAFVPSSSYLSKEMARHLKLAPNDIVVELGPGTGVVTSALLEKISDPSQLVALEYSEQFAKTLHQRFPKLTIIRGNAAHLSELLKPYEGRVTHIISSLPLRTLPLKTSQTILDQIEEILPSGGRYVQFTYGYHFETFGKLRSFHHVYSKRVWLNFPPARVDMWVAP